MKKLLALLLVVILIFSLSGCADMPGRIREFSHQFVSPIKTLERFFVVNLPEDTEIIEYEYLYTINHTAIRSKVSFSADEWDLFYESMTDAGYGSLDEESEEVEDQLQTYEYIEKHETLSWWDFNQEDAEGYYFYYSNGYVKHFEPVYVFAFNDGDFVTVYMALGY